MAGYKDAFVVVEFHYVFDHVEYYEVYWDLLQVCSNIVFNDIFQHKRVHKSHRDHQALFRQLFQKNVFLRVSFHSCI